MLAIDALHRLYKGTAAPIVLARSLGLQVTNAISPLKVSLIFLVMIVWIWITQIIKFHKDIKYFVTIKLQLQEQIFMRSEFDILILKLSFILDRIIGHVQYATPTPPSNILFIKNADLS